VVAAAAAQPGPARERAVSAADPIPAFADALAARWPALGLPGPVREQLHVAEPQRQRRPLPR
jgi:hypothetical protein